MRPGSSYRGAKNRDTLDGQFKIGANGTFSTKNGEIPIRREQSICAAKKRTIGKPPGKTVVELCVNNNAKALKAYTRNQIAAMQKTPSRRPLFAGFPGV